MLKFSANDEHTGDLVLVGLGLTALNLARLKAGQPVLVDRDEIAGLGLPACAVTIFYGRDNDELAEWVERLTGSKIDPHVVEHGGRDESRFVVDEPYLGKATTGQLLDELTARIEVDHAIGDLPAEVADRGRAAIDELRGAVDLDYRTVDSS